MSISFNNPMHVYFIGIGGVSMSGLASILLSKGFKVSGSDARESDLTRKVAKEGATVFYGQEESHLSKDVDLVVYTAAIKADNPEFIHMHELNIPSMTRAEFLGELMRNYNTPIGVSGTHGKTTTTTMISEIMIEAGADPTINVGGVVNSINSNIRDGALDFFVFEACEYTNSFLSFYPKTAVILNIEEDHLDFFKDIDDIRNSFSRFAALLPEDGTLVINSEIPDWQAISSHTAAKTVCYGFSAECDYYATDVTFNEFGNPSFICHIKKTGEAFPVRLNVYGIHNVSNSLAALAASIENGISIDSCVNALSKCSGSKRRFEKKGEVNGILVIDDYAHHPSEIKTALASAHNYPHNRIWCVFQPHTYTRTKAFLHEFAEVFKDCDHVILTDVYAAREKDEYGCNSSNLYEEMKKIGVNATYISDFKEIEKFILQNCTSKDLLITIGAGDVVNIANSLVSK